MINAEKLYNIILLVTEDKNKAEEARSEWLEARIKANKSPDGNIAIDGIGIAQAISELFSGSQNSNS